MPEPANIFQESPTAHFQSPVLPNLLQTPSQINLQLQKQNNSAKNQEKPATNEADTGLNKTVPENIFNIQPLLNADLASLDQLSEVQLAQIPFKMPTNQFDLENPILTLPSEDEESLMRNQVISRSQSQKIAGHSPCRGRKSHSTRDLNKEVKLKSNFIKLIDDQSEIPINSEHHRFLVNVKPLDQSSIGAPTHE